MKSCFRFCLTNSCLILTVSAVLHIIPESSSYSVKCSRGTYFSEGCNHCYCNPKTGTTTCDNSASLCPGTSEDKANVKKEAEVSSKCPHGPTFKDRNGNACKCMDESGAVYCSILNFKKKVTLQKIEVPSEFSHRVSSPVNYPPAVGSESNSYEKLNEDETEGDLSTDDYDLGNNSGSSSSGSSSEEEGENKKKISLETAKDLGLIETADVVDGDSKGMSMLEYSGKSWGLRTSKLPLSQFRKQIEEVLGSLVYS